MVMIGKSGVGRLLFGGFGPLFRGGEGRGGSSLREDWRRGSGWINGESVEVFGFCGGESRCEADETGDRADVRVGVRRRVEEWFSLVEEVRRGAEVVSRL